MDFFKKVSLEGKVAVVTGGAGLLGSSLCQVLASAGAKVFIADINKKKTDLLSKKINNQGFLAQGLSLDITSPKSIEMGINKVLKVSSRVDIWVNAAYPRTKDWHCNFEDVRLKSLKKNVDMHLNGYFICCQKILKVMKKQKKGTVINVASIYGVLGPDLSLYKNLDMTMPSAYSVIKGGIIAFSKFLATSYARHNIRVNVVCPGGIYDHQPPQFLRRYNKRVPLKRMAKAEEVSHCIAFLCSEAASYVTGATLMVDGGYSAW